MKEGSSYYFYHNDHLGTPQKLTAVNGAVVWSAKYSSFGEATIEVEAVENPLRLPGQFFDSETGLHYNWNRYYAPHEGRYFRADPIGLEGGKNLFVYTLNNPIRYIDPFGLKNCSYQGSWGSPSFHVSDVDLDIEFGDFLPNKYLKFHIGTVIANVNGTITLEINCTKTCVECGEHKFDKWTLTPSITDTFSAKFKIRKGPLSIAKSIILAGLNETDLQDTFMHKGIEQWKVNIAKKAATIIGDAKTYCKNTPGK